MMLYYVYDGSFDGLMTAVFESLARKSRPENIITEDSERSDLFGEYVSISTDEVKSAELVNSIMMKMGEEALGYIMYSHLSEDARAGIIIRDYILFGMKAGKKTNMHLTDNAVKPVHDIARKVSRERHRMLGILRFRLVDNDLYYASIDPDHNICGIIAPHFARRMSDQNWIIHDTRRNIAAVYDKKSWMTAAIDLEHTPGDSDSELFYSDLWRSYFKNIAISERKNPKLQKQFLPQRYWKDLTEMN